MRGVAQAAPPASVCLLHIARRHVAPGRAAAGPTAARPTGLPRGLLCPGGPLSPSDYVSRWRRGCRPRLDALWSALLRAGRAGAASPAAAERVLLLADELLMLLRSTRSTAVHLSTAHVAPEWVAAAEQARCIAPCLCLCLVDRLAHHIAIPLSTCCMLLPSGLTSTSTGAHPPRHVTPGAAGLIRLPQV